MEKLKKEGVRRRSRAEMFPLMASYAAGNDTQAFFCASHGLREATFQYWWRRYRADQAAAPGGFLSLSPQGSSLDSELLSLEAGGIRLELRGVSAGFVADLVDKLSGRC